MRLFPKYSFDHERDKTPLTCLILFQQQLQQHQVFCGLKGDEEKHLGGCKILNVVDIEKVVTNFSIRKKLLVLVLILISFS
jgi:hypothetical protein